MMSEKVEDITKENRHANVLFISSATRNDRALSIAELAENENKNIPEKIKYCIGEKSNWIFNVTDTIVVIFLEVNFNINYIRHDK